MSISRFAVNNENRPVSVLVCSNVTLHPFDEFLEKELEPFNVTVKIADFDNVWMGAENAVTDFVFIHNDILNLTVDYTSRFTDKDYSASLASHLESRISGLKQNLQKVNSPKIISTNLVGTALSLSHVDHNVEEMCSRYNRAIGGLTNSVLNFDRALADFGLANSLNWSGFYRFSAPYKHDFLQYLAKQVATEIKRQLLSVKKVLVLDCDNTLWGGVVGEDGASGIKFDDSSPKGKCFNEVQKLIKSLSGLGVLLAVCSKNNYEDAAEAFTQETLPLTMDSFSCVKINWEDKTKNIEEIAKELNLGLDSFVFLDDSSFEISNMLSRRPEVTSLQVPESIFSYPNFFRNQVMPLFNLSKITAEDMNRAEYYSSEKQRTDVKAEFDSKEEYINSLQLEIHIKNNDLNSVARIAQMTNKTNQFNLTTKRYSEDEIAALVESTNVNVLSGSVQDKFGDSGKTILAIVNDLDTKVAVLDTFLMSCRVIGRNLEYAFLDTLINELKQTGCEQIRAKYVKTLKNSQVQDLYDRLGFIRDKDTETVREYYLDLAEYTPKSTEKIGIRYEK